MLNNPLIYWDPHGHWEQGDSNLNVEAQAKIIALTSAYYEAQSPQEKKAIQKQANEIRYSSASKNNVTTPLVFQSAEIEKVVSTAVSKGRYMTGEEWTATINKVGIYSTSSGYASMQGVSTTTTTVIGRTNITVSSRYYYTTDNKTKEITNISTANINFSYNVNDNEWKFLISLATDSDYSLEEALVAYDLLKKNGGEVTNEELKRYGVRAGGKGLGKSSDLLEYAYGLSEHGYSNSEAEAEFGQKRQAEIEAALGFKVSGSFKQGMTFKSKSPKNSVKVKARCNCFTAGTKVLTAEGEKNIDEIKVGDMVLSKNEETGEQAYKEVTDY